MFRASFGFCLIAFLHTVAFNVILVDGTSVIPKPLQKCCITDETCILDQAHLFLKTYAKGFPERNMPQLEPLELGTLKVQNDNRRSISFNLVLENTKLYNFTKMKLNSIKGFSSDPTKSITIRFKSILPELYIAANYKVNGKILVLPLISAGEMTMKLTDVESNTRIKAEPIKRNDGHTYLNVTEYHIMTKLNDLKLDMTNLFNNEKELRESTLKILNENWEVLSEDVQPKINVALQNKLKDILQNFIKDIPYDEYFL